ncbi:hypothetical protein BT63DRAFT_414582 [Microthyrium microscopicum]|uniref:Uncharacterized protein n=1 Tax=Microthyrium microscopicum TaxID=703497 RepID=A0A6A6U8J1_9PEZI|nr:hypothetical protein BT63DRAFT_414582 [Microthyrium microscopicum]
MLTSSLPIVPTTPPNHNHPSDPSSAPPPNRRLWSSPAISDYFSGDETASFTLSPPAPSFKSAATFAENELPKESTKTDSTRKFDPPAGLVRALSTSLNVEAQMSRAAQSQRLLLMRLNAVGRAIVQADLSEVHCERLAVDVSRLESTLAAPDAQSREPAEIAESGLFDEEEEDEEDDTLSKVVEEEEPESETLNQAEEKEEPEVALTAEISLAELERAQIKRQEAAELIARVTKSAEELRERYREMKHVNDIATSKLEAAANEIFRLRQENQTLNSDDKNSDLLYLRLRLNNLEERAKQGLGRKRQEELVDSIEKLSIESSPKRQESRDTGHGASRSPEATMTNSINADYQFDVEEPRKINGHAYPSYRHRSLPEDVFGCNDEPDDKMANDGLSKDDEEDEDESKIGNNKITSSHDEEDESKPLTPWQQLWDGISDFVGIHDYYSE